MIVLVRIMNHLCGPGLPLCTGSGDLTDAPTTVEEYRTRSADMERTRSIEVVPCLVCGHQIPCLPVANPENFPAP